MWYRRFYWFLGLAAGVILAACGSADSASDPLPGTPVLVRTWVPTFTPAPVITLNPTSTYPATAAQALVLSISATPSLVSDETLVPSPTKTLVPAATIVTAQGPTVTPTSTPFALPTRTFTPLPTMTPTHTFTPGPTSTPTPVQVIVSSDVGAYVRSGPGLHYEAVGMVGANSTFDMLAYTINAEGEIWFLITLDSGAQAWISGSVTVPVDQANLSQIPPPATIPASPTPLASATPTLAPTQLPTPTLPTEADARSGSGYNVNLRSGAGLNFSVLDTLSPSTPLRLVGRNADMTWFQVATSDGRRGWIAAELLTIYRPDPETLFVSWIDPMPYGPMRIVSSSTAQPVAVIERARMIFQHGQRLGNNPTALLKIGDSVNVEGNFLHAFAAGNYHLGEYDYLQETIDFFYQSGTYNAEFLTEHTGFKCDMILDPTWSNPALCQEGETPLDCEYRNKRPSIAIVHISLNDMLFYPSDQYRACMDIIVQTLIGYGVIPVMTTFASAPDFRVDLTPEFIAVIRQLAADFQLPLIEFHEAAKALPNHGTGEDGAHLSHRDDWWIAFNGDQDVYGATLRELMTLQVLDDLRKNVIQYNP